MLGAKTSTYLFVGHNSTLNYHVLVLECVNEIQRNPLFLISLILIDLVLSVFFSLFFILQRKWAGLSIGQEIEGKYIF